MKFPDAMTTPPVPASPEKSRIPVMFSATGSWGLPLGVAIHTLCLHASSGRFYDIHIVHDGMDARIIQELNRLPPPFRRFPFLSCNFRKNSAFSFKTATRTATPPLRMPA